MIVIMAGKTVKGTITINCEDVESTPPKANVVNV